MWLLLLQIIAIRVYKYANIKMMDFDDYFIRFFVIEKPFQSVPMVGSSMMEVATLLMDK